MQKVRQNFRQLVPMIDAGGDIIEHNDLGSRYYGLDSGLFGTSIAEQMIMHRPNMIADLKTNRAYQPPSWAVPISTQRMLKPNVLALAPNPGDMSDVIAKYTAQVRNLAGYIPGSG